MSNEENKNPRRRRFDPAMMGEPKMPDVNVMGVMGQMLGGIGTGLGAGLANKMNERVTLAAAALNGLLANDQGSTHEPEEMAKWSVRYADAVLKLLDETEDPRFDSKKMPSIQQVVEEP